ncbi:MAG: hypothetical protein KDG50_03255 [Chromatiales bacterium]|nr:hypothetical protein [Chromatiales bacterium]
MSLGGAGCELVADYLEAPFPLSNSCRESLTPNQLYLVDYIGRWTWGGAQLRISSASRTGSGPHAGYALDLVPKEPAGDSRRDWSNVFRTFMELVTSKDALLRPTFNGRAFLGIRGAQMHLHVDHNYGGPLFAFEKDQTDRPLLRDERGYVIMPGHREWSDVLAEAEEQYDTGRPHPFIDTEEIADTAEAIADAVPTLIFLAVLFGGAWLLSEANTTAQLVAPAAPQRRRAS